MNGYLLATRNVLDSKKESLFIPNCQSRIKIPKPFLSMQTIVSYLQKENYKIYLVTATNIWTARLVASEYFDIEENNVIGMMTELRKNNTEITDIIIKPDPCGDGKVNVLRKEIGNQKPIIAAGNSVSDYALLNYVDEDGLSIWVSEVGTDNQKIREIIKEPIKIKYLYQ